MRDKGKRSFTKGQKKYLDSAVKKATSCSIFKWNTNGNIQHISFDIDLHEVVNQNESISGIQEVATLSKRKGKFQKHTNPNSIYEV